MIAAVLAGGSGTRFWPLSRVSRPKQLVALWGDQPMIGETVDRLQQAGCARVMVVLGEHLVEATLEAVPGLGPEELVVEPAARNTAPAIGLAALRSRARHGDEVLGIFPSDHFIDDTAALGHCLRSAEQGAAAGAIVTLGVRPTRPETGFGYIRYRASPQAQPDSGGPSHPPRYPVEAFVEKPDRATALAYLRAGGYAWNAGIFVFRPSVLLAEIERQMPALHDALARIEGALGTANEDRVLAEAFAQAPSISIDYGVMERAARVEVVEATFGWSDVGHWGALAEVLGADEQGNVVEVAAPRRALVQGCRGTVVHGSGTSRRVVAALGLEDLVVVDTDDAVLILPKGRAQEVRALVEALEAEWTE